jgi:4,5-dihydroxyphthalate decarboxylase
MDGRVKAEGIDLNYIPMMMPESFFRMLRFGEFGASEMSFSWYTRQMFSESRPFTAIPVFPSRMFRHSCIYINVDSGIREPKDLAGKRVGVPEYQMTAVVWIKGILADHYGVPVDSVRYFNGGLIQPGRVEAALQLPPNIKLESIPSHRTLSEMLDSGELDAIYTAHMPSCFEEGSKRVRRLFENYPEQERKYFAESGIFPIMHTIVIRQDVYQANRWVARSLMKAFEESKQLAQKELFVSDALKVMLPWLLAEAERSREVMGPDLWPYGLENNRRVLDLFLRYSFEQGISPRRLTPEELFAPETLAESRI